ADAGRQLAVGVVGAVRGDGKLMQMVAAHDAVGRRANLLHRRRRQADEDAYDRDDDEYFDERKAPALSHDANSSHWDKSGEELSPVQERDDCSASGCEGVPPRGGIPTRL